MCYKEQSIFHSLNSDKLRNGILKLFQIKGMQESISNEDNFVVIIELIDLEDYEVLESNHKLILLE
jgi:hypothetical protein